MFRRERPSRSKSAEGAQALRPPYQNSPQNLSRYVANLTGSAEHAFQARRNASIDWASAIGVSSIG